MGNSISGTADVGVWWSESMTASGNRLVFDITTSADANIMAFNSDAMYSVSAAIASCTASLGTSCDFSDIDDQLYLCSDGDMIENCKNAGWTVTKGDSYYFLAFTTPGTTISGEYYFYDLTALIACLLVASAIFCFLSWLRHKKRNPQQQQQPSVVMVPMNGNTPNAVMSPQNSVAVNKAGKNSPVIVTTTNAV